MDPIKTKKTLPNTINLTPETESIILNPILKWAGGKRWLVPILKKHLDRFSNYRLVEPFCGGLAISLGLNPKEALLNDINPLLINFYKWVKKGLIIELNMVNDEFYYYECRDSLNELISSKAIKSQAIAELFYYLNKTGYNGLCRFNSNGLYNVPYGRYKTINYHKDLTVYKDIFSNFKFTNTDFSLLKIKPGDIIYADPPYDVEFTKYAKEDFTYADQERLINWLNNFNNPIIISNQATKRIIKLYEKNNYKLDYLAAPRMISCNGNRDKACEILAFKNF